MADVADHADDLHAFVLPVRPLLTIIVRPTAADGSLEVLARHRLVDERDRCRCVTRWSRTRGPYFNGMRIVCR